MVTKDCLDDSDSDREDSKRPQPSSTPSSQRPPITTPSPDPVTSPDPDLDVEEDTVGEAPENLSLKKETTAQEASSSPHPQPLQQQNFLPYPQFPQFTPFQPQQYPLQRSPVDILLRVFPGRRRSDVEALLQR